MEEPKEVNVAYSESIKLPPTLEIESNLEYIIHRANWISGQWRALNRCIKVSYIKCVALNLMLQSVSTMLDRISEFIPA